MGGLPGIGGAPLGLGGAGGLLWNKHKTKCLNKQYWIPKENDGGDVQDNDDDDDGWWWAEIFCTKHHR